MSSAYLPIAYLPSGRLLQIAGAGKPRARHAALSVLASRQAIVIGPTPPGTGVMWPATRAQSSKSQVADDPRLAALASIAVDADIDHRRARLDPVALDHFAAGRPPRSGCRRGGRPSPRSRVREWAMVTVHSPAAAVAPPACRRCSSVRPPPPRARRACRGRLGQHHAAERRAGHQRVLPGGQPPGIDRRESHRRPWPD